MQASESELELLADFSVDELEQLHAHLADVTGKSHVKGAAKLDENLRCQLKKETLRLQELEAYQKRLQEGLCADSENAKAALLKATEHDINALSEATARLAQLELEEIQVNEDCKRAVSAAEELEGYGDEFWALQGQGMKSTSALGEAGRAEEQRKVALDSRLACLTRTNVMSDAFFVWHDGNMGTINGLGLGKATGARAIDWPQVNAALGQVALLVTTIAKQVNHTFTTYVVIPMGSFSKIAKVGDERTCYELYYTVSYSYFKRSLNTALGCLLCCIDELCVLSSTQNRAMAVPYAIQGGDKVGGLSIRLGADEAKWTRGLKYMLTNLKWLQAWCAKHHTR